VDKHMNPNKAKDINLYTKC